MLFDRGCIAKSKPWSAASSVPLICAGPGLRANATVDYAVSTVDLAPTFLDFASVLNRAPTGMSRASLRPAMALGSNSRGKGGSNSGGGHGAGSDRGSSNSSINSSGVESPVAVAAAAGATDVSAPPPVHFGLNNFRGVVITVNASCVLKFFCCPDTVGETAGCPGSTPRDRAGFAPGQSEHHLYNIASDRFELPQNDLRHRYPDLVRQMAAMLPPPHQTPPNNHSSVHNQGFGYRWPGCTL